MGIKGIGIWYARGLPPGMQGNNFVTELDGTMEVPCGFVYIY
jgi:hypothetical protein